MTTKTINVIFNIKDNHTQMKKDNKFQKNIPHGGESDLSAMKHHTVSSVSSDPYLLVLKGSKVVTFKVEILMGIINN